MRHQLSRLARVPGLTAVVVTLALWTITGFALTDPELSPKAFLGGAKAMFVALSVLMTLIALHRAGLFGRRD